MKKIVSHCSRKCRMKDIQRLRRKAPQKKRLRAKAPEVELKEEPVVKQEVFDADNNQMTVSPTTYAYPDTTILRTRKMVQGLGAQKFTRRAQQHLLSHTHTRPRH